jgi:hypothetical protein
MPHSCSTLTAIHFRCLSDGLVSCGIIDFGCHLLLWKAYYPTISPMKAQPEAADPISSRFDIDLRRYSSPSPCLVNRRSVRAARAVQEWLTSTSTAGWHFSCPKREVISSAFLLLRSRSWLFWPRQICPSSSRLPLPQSRPVRRA